MKKIGTNAISLLIVLLLGSCVIMPKFYLDSKAAINPEKSYIFGRFHEERFLGLLSNVRIQFKEYVPGESYNIIRHKFDLYFLDNSTIQASEVRAGTYILNEVYVAEAGKYNSLKINEEMIKPFTVGKGEMVYIGDFYRKGNKCEISYDYVAAEKDLIAKFNVAGKIKINNINE